MSDLIFRSDEATKGGFQAVVMVEGVLNPPQRVDPWKSTGEQKYEPKDRVEVTLDDAIILEMEEGEPEPDLENSQFRFWMNYAGKGKEKAHTNTFYVQGFLTSAEKLAEARGTKGGGLADIIGTRVILRKTDVFLFKRPKDGQQDAPKEEREYEEFYQTNFTFQTDDSGGGAVDLDAQAKSIVVGKSKAMAIRDLTIDQRLKTHPEYKQAIADGSITDMLGVELVNGIYKEVASEAGGS